MKNDKQTFAAEMAELEAITTWFEGSDIDLDEALTKFERGMVLATNLQKQLATVENRIEKIKVNFASAQAVVEEPAESDQEDDGDAPTTSTEPGLF